jgi:hypothetical protein
MLIRFTFERGEQLTATEILGAEAPNAVGGIGNLTVRGKLWTGSIHVEAGAGRFTVHLGNVKLVETRSNDWETDEPWLTRWREPDGGFRYEPYYQLGSLLHRMMQGKE